jgi:glycosyltransferase involved in cell wall biosynthesis
VSVRTAALVPAYNAAASIAAVVTGTQPVLSPVVVVDDGSSDDTAALAAAAGAEVLRHPVNQGKGAALVTGLQHLATAGVERALTLDADGQHLPEELPVVIKPIIDGVADHVNGSRILGEPDRGSLVRYLGVHFFSGVVTVLTGQRVTDISSGYRATRADTLRKLILEQDQFWTSEVTIEALRQHARVVEVPVTFLTRRGGESKKPKTVRYAWHFSKAIGKTWLR